MYLLDLLKITLRSDGNLNEITNEEITNIISDQQLKDLNIKGAEVFYLLEAMKKLQAVLPNTDEFAVSFKTKCTQFVTRVCNLSDTEYTTTEVNIFSDFLYYYIMYFEILTKFSTDVMLNDIHNLELIIGDYDEYVSEKSHDAIWLAVELLKVLLVQLYNINFSLLIDKTKPLEIINRMENTIEERRALQYETINSIKTEI